MTSRKPGRALSVGGPSVWRGLVEIDGSLSEGG